MSQPTYTTPAGHYCPDCHTIELMARDHQDGIIRSGDAVRCPKCGWRGALGKPMSDATYTTATGHRCPECQAELMAEDYPDGKLHDLAEAYCPACSFWGWYCRYDNGQTEILDQSEDS
jgi:ssDNA-binding Zn-finger/Zn-ribbon topoisomerase 1